MTRLFPQSLAGRLIFWLLASLLLVQLGFTFVQEQQRKFAVREVIAKSAETRAIVLARVLENVEPTQWTIMMKAAAANDMAFQVDGERTFGFTIPHKMRILHKARVIERHPPNFFASNSDQGTTTQVWIKPDAESKETGRSPAFDIQSKKRVIRTSGRSVDKMIGRLSVIVDGQTRNRFREASTGLSVQLDDGRWLNAKVAGLESPPFSWENWAPLFVTGLLLAIVVISVVHLETRPLKALARAADQLGRGEKLAPLHETGPKETRAALRAFNQMGDKISRFVGDRTQMLAAMSHDLRTPLTSMRLRIEDVEDEDLREKLVASIDEMKHMSEAVLAFARADAADEPTALTDLGQLAGCVVSEYKEMDQPVTLGVVGDTQVHVRPMAMKRALRNLIENAVRYGYSAKVSLVTHDGQAIFEISDEGSGIAETDMERVFEPFIRLETSRNRETGGAGLGLAITRSIVRSHGGELTLENQTNGGLLARIRLFTARS